MLTKLYRRLFFAFLVWVPIPLGSNRPIFWALNAIFSIGIFTLVVIDEWRGDRTRPAVRRAILILLALAAVPLIWMLIQALSLTPGFLHNPVWTNLEPTGVSWSGAISVNPGATLSAAANYITVALAGIVAARIAMSSQQTLVLLNAIIVSAAVVAGWGLIAREMDWPQRLFGITNDSGAGLTSVFVNRNTAATFLALGLVTALAVLMGRLERGRSPTFLSAVADFPRRAGVYLLLVALIGIALLQTGSRAGIAAGALGSLIVLIVGFRRTAASSHWVAAALIVGGGIGLVLFGGSASGLLDRLTEAGFGDDSRWQLYADTLAAIWDRPLLGFGAGTFYDFFPAYHSQELGVGVGIWLEAHNTWLQSAAELGLPMFLFAAGTLVVIGGWFTLGAFRRDEPMPGAVAAAGAVVVVGFHAFFDFSLQVQAVAILFAALVGAGIAGPVRAALRRRPETLEPAQRAERRYESYSVAPQSPPRSR